MNQERTLEQRRATYALKVVDSVGKAGGGTAGEYATLCSSFPTLVLASGLGQALAFLMSKGSDRTAQGQLLGHIDAWMCRENEHSPYCNTREPDLLRAVMAGSQDQYAVAQAEVLALMGWLKRCAKAYIENGAKGSV